MILPNDILIRETSDGPTVWVSQRMVVEKCGVNKNSLDTQLRLRYKKSLPSSWQKVADRSEFFLGSVPGKSWRWGRKNGQYYYDIDTIPNRKPCCYRDRLPSKEELIARVDENRLRDSRERQAELRRSIREAVAELVNEEDANWIRIYSGYQLPLATVRDYARALAWCRFICRTTTRKQVQLYGASTIGRFYEACAEVLAELRLSNFRVGTAASLRKKMIGFPSDPEQQRLWIISGKIGNSNRRIVGKQPLIDYETGEVFRFDIHEAIMFRAYMNPGNPEKEHLQELYDKIYCPLLSEFQIAPVAYRTFCNHITRFSKRILMDLERHGAEYYKKHLLTYTPTEKLSYAHSLFCGDGSGLLQYSFWKKVRDDRGRIREELDVRNLYAILISDVASGYIAGWSFSPEGFSKETPDMVMEAVRMAVRNGGNQTMFEFVSDNAPGFSQGETREFLKCAFNRVRRIKAGNSQANPAETQFRLFKNSTLRSIRSFVRSSHNASIKNRANLDGLRAEDYPDYATTIAIFKRAVEDWNNKPMPNGKTPAEMFANKNPECRPLDAVSLRLINGSRTVLSISRMRGFIAPEGGKAEVKYEIPDYSTDGIQAIQRATGYGYDSKVEAVYDRTGCDLYSIDGRFILTCPVTELAKMAHIEKTDAHRQAQLHHSHRKQEQNYQSEQFRERVQEAYSKLDDMDYDTVAHFHPNEAKAITNDAYDTYAALTLQQKRSAERTLKRNQKTQERHEEKQRQQAREDIAMASLEYRKKKISDISKYLK